MEQRRAIRGSIDGWRKNGTAFETHVDVDGASADNVNITVSDGVVTVEASHNSLEMFRSFSLPPEVASGWVTAHLADSRLTVRVEADRPGIPRRINVET